MINSSFILSIDSVRRTSFFKILPYLLLLKKTKQKIKQKAIRTISPSKLTLDAGN